MRRPRTLGGWLAWASFALALVPFVFATMAAYWFIFLRCGQVYYSPGFTELKFASLREGMPAGEVKAVVGAPRHTLQSLDDVVACSARVSRPRRGRDRRSPFSVRRRICRVLFSVMWPL